MFLKRLYPPYIIVNMVVHECHNAVFCRDVCGEDVEMGGITTIPEYQLLAPVAEEVSLKVWCCLCPVA